MTGNFGAFKAQKAVAFKAQKAVEPGHCRLKLSQNFKKKK